MWIVLLDTYLGKNHVNLMATELEGQLHELRYHGDERRVKFDTFHSRHVEIHNRLSELKTHGYAGMDPGTRVRHVMDGLVGPWANQIRGQMSVNTDLQTDFDGVCCVIRLYLQSQKTFTDENKRQLSSFERRAGGDGAKFQGSDSEAEEAGRRAGLRLDVKYSPAQYQSFTPAEKHYLWLHRAERISAGGSSGGGRKPGKRGRSLHVLTMAPSPTRTSRPSPW